MATLNGRPAQAVAPLTRKPPVTRDWAVFGLPDTGWILVHDESSCDCEQCGGRVGKHCQRGCAAEFGLNLRDRLAMGTCSHCDPAPCADACPVSAFARTAQGIVEIDQELCIGCRFCLDACPSHALMMIDPCAVATPPTGVPDYSPHRLSGDLPGTVVKCNLCTARLLKDELPVCVKACPYAGLWVGSLDRDTATNGRRVQRLTALLGGRRCQVTEPGRRVVTLMP